MDKLAVLIPCYNEGKTIEKVVTDCKKAIANISNSVVYVYDNNSTDDTVELAEKAGAVVRVFCKEKVHSNAKEFYIVLQPTYYLV